jgi:uncharacterized metal-binding protein YceD (DUF177 family)
MEPSHDLSGTEVAGARVKISDVVRNPNAVTRLHGDYTFEDLKTEGTVACDWQLKPETAGLSVHGTVHGTLLLECARCLEAFPVPVDLELDERYVFDRFVDPYEKEKELSAEDFFEVVSEEGDLDLRDLAHQFLILEADEHSLCGRMECRFVQPDA